MFNEKEKFQANSTRNVKKYALLIFKSSFCVKYNLSYPLNVKYKLEMKQTFSPDSIQLKNDCLLKFGNWVLGPTF